MKIVRILYCLIIIVFFTLCCKAQRAKVEIGEFLVDGRSIDCNYDLTISVNGKKIRPRFDGSTFAVPKQVRAGREIAIRLVCGAYTISMRPLGQNRFFAPNNGRYIWKAGIDSYPFEEANVPSDIEDKVAEVHYIKFDPYGYVGTQLQIFIPKKRKFAIERNTK